MEKKETHEKAETQQHSQKKQPHYDKKESAMTEKEESASQAEQEKNTEKKEANKQSEQETIQDLTETLQRLQAEFDNFRKRNEKEKAALFEYGKADTITKFLPIIDSFEIALQNTQDKEKFAKGMEMLFAQYMGTLKHEGLRPINAVGKQFDPHLHEVMLKQKSEKDDGVILEELQKGYMLNSHIIRHSKVKISEKNTNEKNNGE